MRRTKMNYTQDDLTRALREVVGRLGEGVTLDQFVRESGISSAPVVRLFGGWSGLRAAVGLSARGQKPTPAVWTHEQLQQKLIEAVGVYGEGLTLEQFVQSAGISPGPIYHLFGSWPALQESVGLRARRRQRLRRGSDSPREMLRRVDGVMHEWDPPVNLKELASRTGLTSRQVEAEFGSWDELLEMSFVETRNGRLERLSDEELERLFEWTERVYRRMLEWEEGEAAGEVDGG
jgi:AcrR family transcriptional regulator